MHRSNTKPGFRLGCVFNVGGKSCLCVFWGVDAEANPRLVTPLGEKSLRWKVSSGHGFGAKKAWGFQQKWRLKLKHFTRAILYGMIMVMVLMMMMMMMMMMYAKRMEIYREMPNATDTTSTEHRALTLTVRTPQCGHTVWGIKPMSSQPEYVNCYRGSP